MNLNKGPSKEEVMGWSPQNLADYMKRLNLPGCDKVVMKGSISGAQFIHMTECDLQVFPSIYIPIITKIHSEVTRQEQKWCFGNRSKEQYRKQVFVQEEEQWDSDESDNDNDDYEGPDEEDDNYICTQTEPPTADEQDSDETYEVDFEPQSPPHTMRPPPYPRPVTSQDCHSRDPVRYPTPTKRTSKPPRPLPPRTNHTPQPPFRAPAAVQPSPHIDRSIKPGHSSPAHTDFPKSKGSTVEAPGSSSGRFRPPTAPKPTAVQFKMPKLTPAPPVPTQRTKVSSPKPAPRKCIQELDPIWYGGKLTRHQAESILREVNKDGAFVVRDSTKGSTEHPYTLMLLKDDKVYNIKIRNQGNVYSLGTGLKNSQTFPGVTEMITHHTLTPLLLIDATDLNSEVNNQSCLLYPAGL